MIPTILQFRALLRAKNVLEPYTDFSWEGFGIDEQTFENYKSKYRDLYEKIKSENVKQKTSILDDIDFEVEPSILKAREIGELIIHKMKEFVEVFVKGMIG